MDAREPNPGYTLAVSARQCRPTCKSHAENWSRRQSGIADGAVSKNLMRGSNRKLPKRKRPSLARGPFSGGGTQARRLLVPNLSLLRLLLLVRSGGWGGRGARELLQVVLQQTDFYASAAHMLGLGVLIRVSDRSVAHAYEVDPIDGNLVAEDKVAHDRLGHLL